MRAPLFILSILVLAGCAAQKADIAPGATPLVESPEAGLWMAMERAERRLLTSGKIERDEALQAYVRNIACRLASEYCGDVRIYVVHRPDFNAAMAPNGFMVIWTGALLRAENEAQIATVIGHELAHYIRRHSLQRWEEMQATLNVALVLNLASALAGVSPVGDAMTLIAAGHLAAYSREHEREADKLGFEMMIKAGYAPMEAPKLWSGLVAERDAADEERPGLFLSTHPPFDERLRTLTEMAETAAAKDGSLNVRNEGQFLNHVLMHRAEWLEDELDLGRFEKVQVLIDRFKQGAAGLGNVWYYQAELYRRRGEDGDVDKALDAYREALHYDDAPATVYRGLGFAHWSKGEDSAARSAFETYLAKAAEAEDREMIRYYLGQLEDKM